MYKRILSIFLVVCLVAGILPVGLTAYAEGGHQHTADCYTQDGTLTCTLQEDDAQESDQTSTSGEDSNDASEENTTEPTGEDGIALTSIDPDDAVETAVITAPGQLKFDGSKSYIIFTSCIWGGHTYAIGPDATATANLGMARDDCTPNNTIYLAQASLGWTLTKTDDGLFIENNGKYLTVSEDRKSLTVSNAETASDLTIIGGTLALAGAATETVYLQEANSTDEPVQGQRFQLTEDENHTVFYFAEVQAKQETPEPTEGVLFPELLPQNNFHARIVSPDKVYGDDQYVIFTEKDGEYVAITGLAQCSSPLALNKAPAVNVDLSSPDQDVLWTVNNNREKSIENNYHKFIRSCASNKYLAPVAGLLDDEIHDEFYLTGKDGKSALIATESGQYVALVGDGFGLTTDPGAASRFYFARLMQDNEQQTASGITEVPEGTLLRLVDWNNIDPSKEYAIISATELNELHYALSGNGRLVRYYAEKITGDSMCPAPVGSSGVHGAAPCNAQVGDMFYSNGEDISWTVTSQGNNTAYFMNNGTGLYLYPSEGTAAEQTPSISSTQAAVTIEPVAGTAYAYLKGNTNYLGIWQYIYVGVSMDAPECCAYYLAEVIDPNAEELPATVLNKIDPDPNTVSFGGIYSVYQGSQHVLNGGTSVESFIMMDDTKGSFTPSKSEYDATGKNNYYVTYCADWETDMPVFTEPGQYQMVSLDEYDGFDESQKAALAAIIPNCYPYVTVEEFLANMADAEVVVSANCGADEIMAGIQAAIYSITNPGTDWGYEESVDWVHNSYEVNKSTSYVADPAQAEKDVNAVRDYLLGLIPPAPAVLLSDTVVTEDGQFTKVENGDYFALITEIGGEYWALTNERHYVDYYGEYGEYYDNIYLAQYDPGDIQQLWYTDEHGSLQWFPGTIYKDSQGNDLQFLLRINTTISNGSVNSENNQFSTSENYNFYGYPYYEYERLHHYGVQAEGNTLKGYVPVKLEDGHIALNDYAHKFKDLPEGFLPKDFDPDNASLSILYGRFDDGYDEVTHLPYYYFSLGDINIFDKPTNDPNEVIFKQEKVTPSYPNFVEYDLETDDWSVTQRDESYDVTISGKLNFPPREKFDNIMAVLYINGSQVGTITPKQVGEQTFTVTRTGIPDDEEVHFTVVIMEKYVGVNVFVPDDHGWQLQIGGVYNTAYRELHESTISIPVEKVWTDADTKDHSGDEVEVRLMEDGEPLNRDTVILNEDNSWTDKFKHVPYEHWTYNPIFYMIEEEQYDMDPAQYEALERYFKIPLRSHQYTVEEVNVPEGYTVTYGSIGGAKPVEPQEPVVLDPSKSYPVQVVYTPEGSDTEGGETPLLLSLMEGQPQLSPKIDVSDLSLEKIFDELLKKYPGLEEDMKKNPELKEEVEAECQKEYAMRVMMAQGQKFFLNGDQTLVSKVDYDFAYEEKTDTKPITVSIDFTMGDFLNFESTDQPGKYFIKYLGKYLQVVGDSKPYITPVDRSDATVFEIQAFDAPNTAYSTIPTGSFEPTYAALQVYENGMPMTQVLTMLEDPSSHEVKYAFSQIGFQNFEAQLYMIGCYDGQFMALSPLDPELTVLLEPAGTDAPGEYLAKVTRMNDPAEEDIKPGDTVDLVVSNYICMDKDTRQLVYSEDKDDPKRPAVHFGVQVIPIEDLEDIFTGNFDGGTATPAPGLHFIVINTPKKPGEPDPVDPPDPVNPPVDPPSDPTATLTVSKTVSGEDADPEEEFTFIVTLGNKHVDGRYGSMTFTSGVASFTLKHGEKITASGLPITTYEVVETTSDGYTVTVNGELADDATASGKLTSGKPVKLAFNNDTSDPPVKPTPPVDTTPPENPTPTPPENPTSPETPTPPVNPDVPILPQTGQLWWPVWILIAAGAVIVAIGIWEKKRYHGKHEA